MVQMVGKYILEKNENLDEYFKAVGVPYIVRKLMTMSTPTMEIKQEDEKWSITISTMMRTVNYLFKLGEEYDEVMPGGVIKSVTDLEGDTLKTTSVLPNGDKTTRIYQFTDSNCVIVLKHEKSGIEAKRYFNRV